MGTDVIFRADGGSGSGYLASPTSGKGPGVVVIHEWWGLNDQIRGVADMLAERGFNALAADFYHGKSAEIGRSPDAQALQAEMISSNTMERDGRAAAMYLAQHRATSSRKVGVIGFCMGGYLALLTGTSAPAVVAAIVDCYGVGPGQPDLARLKDAAFLGIFGGKDHRADPTVLDAGLTEAGVPHEIHVYPEADHAFMNERRANVYRADDAADAWKRSLAFLSDCLT